MVEIVDRVVLESVEKEDIKGFTPETVVWPFGRKGPVIFTNVGGEARRLGDWPVDPTGPTTLLFYQITKIRQDSKNPVVPNINPGDKGYFEKLPGQVGWRTVGRIDQ